MLSQLVSITYESLNCKIASIHIQPNAWNQICMSATENDPCILEVIVISLNLTFNDKENWETPEENKNVGVGVYTQSLHIPAAACWTLLYAYASLQYYQAPYFNSPYCFNQSGDPNMYIYSYNNISIFSKALFKNIFNTKNKLRKPTATFTYFYTLTCGYTMHCKSSV